MKSVLSDETIKKGVRKSLVMREPQWELVEQLIPALQFLDKAMERMCGGRHVGLAFIYPVIMNMINTTLSVEAFVPAPVHTFKTRT